MGAGVCTRVLMLVLAASALPTGPVSLAASMCSQRDPSMSSSVLCAQCSFSVVDTGWSWEQVPFSEFKMYPVWEQCPHPGPPFSLLQSQQFYPGPELALNLRVC